MLYKKALGLLDLNNVSDLKALTNGLAIELHRHWEYVKRGKGKGQGNKRGRPNKTFTVHHEYALIEDEDVPQGLPAHESRESLQDKEEIKAMAEETPTRSVWTHFFVGL
jgi:hypothetical protein